VRVSPGASRAGVAGLHGEALRVRVSARPVEGAANRELLQVLAGALGIRPSALTIEAGTLGREKRVRVEGLDAGAVRERLGPALSVDRGRAHN
jgi:hypothetical protein